jgi:hypothetical protein
MTETNENTVVDEIGGSNSDIFYETIILTDEVWASCPENPWIWTTWKKWLNMSAVGLYGFLAFVQNPSSYLAIL